MEITSCKHSITLNTYIGRKILFLRNQRILFHTFCSFDENIFTLTIKQFSEIWILEKTVSVWVNLKIDFVPYGMRKSVWTKNQGIRESNLEVHWRTTYKVTNFVISKYSLSLINLFVCLFIYEHTKASLEERGWSRMSQISICFFLHPRRCFIASSSATSWATLSLKSANVFWLSEYVRNYGLTAAELWMS